MFSNNDSNGGKQDRNPKNKKNKKGIKAGKLSSSCQMGYLLETKMVEPSYVDR